MKTGMSWTVIALVTLVPAAAIANGAGFGTFSKSPEAESSLVTQATTMVDLDIAQAARDALLVEVDRPSAQPEVYRTVIEGNYALASWHWGEAGGQTVLSRTSGQWAVLSSGGGANDVSTLEQVGVPSEIAQRLIERDRAAWQQP